MNNRLSNLYHQDIKIGTLNDPKQHGVAPLLSHFEKKTQQSRSIQKINLYEQAKFQHWQSLATQLFTQMHHEKIEFIVLKGFAYSTTLYANSNIRPYSDIDIFIAKKDYPRMKSLLLKLGFQQHLNREGRLISQQNSFFIDDNFASTIDVHWQINNKPELYQHYEFANTYAQSIEIEKPEYHFKTLNVVDSFLLASFHYITHKPIHRKHIWLYDLALLWQTMTSEQQQKCLKKAPLIQQSQIVNAVLKTLQQTFAKTFQDLSTLEINPNEASAAYIANGSSMKIRLKNTKNWLDKFQLLKEYAFPQKTFVLSQLNKTSNSNSPILFLYFQLWFKELKSLFHRNKG